MFRPSISRVPLIFVWPGHIAGGQRFSGPVVSMIDALPTILELVGLPMPEVMQGQSLAPLLLYDLWNDPMCLHSVHEEHPNLVEKYTAFLEAQWEAHQALAQYFTPSESVALTPEQLETLRALGYIQ